MRITLAAAMDAHEKKLDRASTETLVKTLVRDCVTFSSAKLNLLEKAYDHDDPPLPPKLERTTSARTRKSRKKKKKVQTVEEKTNFEKYFFLYFHSIFRAVYGVC